MSDRVVVPHAGRIGDRELVVLSENPLIPVLVPHLCSTSDVPEIVSSVGALTGQSTAATRNWEQREGLAKLVMQIAHRCNLTCPYCISDAGRWGSADGGLMRPDIVRKALRFFAREYGSIGTIYLFGGEPTLNLDAIQTVCDEVEHLVSEGVLDRMPDVGFTTNGTILNSNLLDLLSAKTYLKISVSLDGPPEVHDHFRRDVGGKPTYEKIVRNISTLRQATGRPSALEITYNVAHLRSGMSLWDIMKALADTTGIRVISVEYSYNTNYSRDNFDPLLADAEMALGYLEEAIANSIRSILSDELPVYYYLVLAFLKGLFNKHQPNFCPAGRNYFTVSCNGQVYPCQNLPENPATFIGHLDDPTLADKIADAPIRHRIDAANHNADRLLGDRWFANFCKVCPAYNFGETGTFETYAPSRAKLYERAGTVFLREILHVAEDSARYQNFCRNVSSRLDEVFELNVF